MNRPVHPSPQPLTRFVLALQSRAELRLALEGEQGGHHRLSALPQATLERWLDDVASTVAGMDRKAAAAYLVGYLSWELALGLGFMRLEGHGVPDVPADAFSAHLEPYNLEGKRYLRVSLLLADQNAPCLALDASGVSRLIRDWFTPFLAQVHITSQLGRTALWRIVGDNVAAAWLWIGKSSGDHQRAMADAELVIHAEGSPLSNKQLRFFKVEARDRADPERVVACEWFHARGGCCRYYTTGESGGEFCFTCVLRSPASMHDILVRDLLEQTSTSP